MTDSILHWNQIALDAARIDFSTDDPTKNPMPQQGGPTRTSRALAMIHIAMHDAFVGASGGTIYLGVALPAPMPLNAARIAVAYAAYLTLIDLFSNQFARIQAEHTAFIAMLSATDAEMTAGMTWGNQIANRMRADRANDNSNVPGPDYIPGDAPGAHRVDPIDPAQGFLGPNWGSVAPFGIVDLVNKVPSMPPPAMDSQIYADHYNAVLKLGSATGSTRTPDQTTIGLYWAYDGPRNLGVPPRLYNQVVREISIKKGATEAENAKLFAVVNIAMADAGIQAWHEKYVYNVWRPVVGIREADAGWGPTGLGDGNVGTAGDPYWVPLGAPRTNQPLRPAGTPNFPAYPSGHATFGTAALVATQKTLNLPANFEFNFVSEELDGKSVGTTGIRTKLNRKLTIASAIEENVLSRVYLGVHWEFDGREGERNGRFIAEKIAAAFPQKAII
ncbi:MAG: phosphatase PAP2 family protein [Acidobacteria bacterium]|nr:phosphatase PAP2 family protein [Acidobacteriota bacterium]